MFNFVAMANKMVKHDTSKMNLEQIYQAKKYSLQFNARDKLTKTFSIPLGIYGIFAAIVTHTCKQATTTPTQAWIITAEKKWFSQTNDMITHANERYAYVCVIDMVGHT